MTEKRSIEEILKESRDGQGGKDGYIRRYVYERLKALRSCNPFERILFGTDRSDQWQSSEKLYRLAVYGYKEPKAYESFKQKKISRIPEGAVKELPEFKPATGALLEFLRLPLEMYLKGIELIDKSKDPEQQDDDTTEPGKYMQYFYDDILCWRELYGSEPVVADALIRSEEALCYCAADILVKQEAHHHKETERPFCRKNTEGNYWPVCDTEQSLAATRVWILMVEGPGLL